MAERRMFAKRIIESASFLKMPISSREFPSSVVVL